MVLCGGVALAGVPSCETIWEEKCWDEPRQQCDTIQKPHQTTSYKVSFQWIIITLIVHYIFYVFK